MRRRTTSKTGNSTTARPFPVFWKSIPRIIAAACAASFTVLAYVYITAADVRSLAASNPSTTSFMELRAREARASSKRVRRQQHWIPLSRISPQLREAVLVAEDAAFWQHDGLDYNQLQESLEVDWARGSMIRGASTITQQLAKNLYLTPSRNPIRKVRELIIARRLEAELSKSRILELYLNVVEWGDGIYGAEAASRAYFGTAAAALDAPQSALLAGALINPRLLNPARPTKRLIRRQQLILKRMRADLSPVAETTTVQ
jgi:monofunctional biosynthetic peptidoglycan transglycosylase